MAVSIENPHDPRLADYADLRTPRDAEWFVVESALAVGRLLTSPYDIRSILVSTAGLERMADDLATTDAPVYVAPSTCCASWSASTCIAGCSPARCAVRRRRSTSSWPAPGASSCSKG